MSTDPGLRRLALGTLLSAFRGEQAPRWAVDLLAEGLAGHVLFGFNIVERGQLATLSASLHAARDGVLIGIDEEGGDVTRLAHHSGSPYPGNAALGVLGDPAITRRVYRTIGAELDELGLNLNLAPTVDVNTADDNPIIGTRSFGADPQAVAAHTAAAVLGLQSAGVAACAKHFPGHGATLADSHLELPTVDIDLSVLRGRELPPFVAAIEAGTKSIMTAHIRVPSLTGDAPATFSRAVLVDLLRGDLGFDGVVVTDALEMLGAARHAGSVPAGAVLALSAGADLLCIGADVDEALTLACVDEIVAAVHDGRLPVARLEEAVARVTALAEWTRQGDRTDREEPGVGYPAALGAVRIEGKLDAGTPPLIVQLESESSIAAGRVPWGLGPHVNSAEQVRVVADQTDAAQLRARAGTRPIVVVGRNVHRLPGARALVEGLAETHTVTVVEMGWPSSWRPTKAQAFITTWGASHANGRAAAQTLGLAA
ncbi:glycoside hydrolase family 3 protein [Dactylosporangium fulvum]|uniref:Glycoside hydrolase family 3 protein n=1 Tax=Dactylosporangium fulvum TaxID=53359 RepID=A0ABY5W1Z2_9ACTN|nr:glycoside hydrolase family 3 protein [Dactylosporangium fulvum]UWP84018.1 glycoside hydrolase family 3 protein [Dactylosporangium fulvum]